MSTVTLPRTIDARCEASILSAALRVVLPFAQGKQPIHSGVRITADEGKLTLECTNGDQHAMTSVAADIMAQGVIVVPIKPLDGIMHTVSGAAHLTMDDTMLVVTCGSTTMQLHTLPAEEWVRFEVPEGPWVDLTSHWPGIRRVLHAAAPEREENEKLKALHFNPKGVVCCDRYRLAAYLIDDAGFPATNVPASLVERIVKLADQSSIACCLTETKASFRSGPTTFTGRLILEQYGNWEALLRQDDPISLRVDREELLAVLSRMKVLADDSGFRRVYFDRVDDTLILTASGPDVGTIHDEIACSGNYDGRLQLEIPYLVDIAQNHTDDEIEFTMVELSKSIQVRDGNWAATTMPVLRPAPGTKA